MKQPDIEYSQYKIAADNPEHCCKNCECYKVETDKKGICYEYEVLPQAGCKFFKPGKQSKG